MEKERGIYIDESAKRGKEAIIYNKKQQGNNPLFYNDKQQQEEKNNAGTTNWGSCTCHRT